MKDRSRDAPRQYGRKMVKTPHETWLDLATLRRNHREARPEVSAELRTRVLIIVEDRLAGKHLARLLAAKGYEGVRVVRRAASALFLARQFSPGIVFLDIALADDAYELANDLRRQCGTGSSFWGYRTLSGRNTHGSENGRREADLSTL